MKPLASLLADLPAQVIGPSDISITDIVFDSRKVTPGCLFVALRGVHQDGHGFIAKAIADGAAAVLSEQRIDSGRATLVVVPDTLSALSRIAVRFWDYPSEKLLMVGITGTNGKTTVSFLIESIFQAAGLATGVLGTINYRFKEQSVPAPNTTPFSSDLQRFLAQVVQGGGRACVMEVSSHALSLNRVDSVDFDVAVFTNLSQDHLDFHKTIEAYGQAKNKLFESLSPQSQKPYPRRAILNADDPWSARIVPLCKVPVMRYGMQRNLDVFATHVESSASGSRFELHAGGKSWSVRFALLGDYNIMNALSAAAVGFSQTMAPEAIVQGLEAIRGVPGRMERVEAGQPFSVIVDYAHTEDALRHVLSALRNLHPKRLLTVFGCGGDRDRIKRPLMGEVAARLSDEVFLTSDNPRSEDPARITLDAEVGIRRVRSDHYKIILDRAEAICAALAAAVPGDIVLIAGKGHETYQILADQTIPFDDREVVRQCLHGSLASRAQ